MADLESMLLDRYIDLRSNEPAQDAGGHPSHDVHERIGAAWAKWDRECAALRTLISVRLFNDAVEARRAERTAP